MDVTRKHHPVWGNPLTKEHTWYALTDKWLLAQKLIIPKIQFTDHMKLKEEDQNMDASVLLRRGNKIFMGGNTGTNSRADIEGKAIQRLPHLGIHPLCSHQTQSLLLMTRSACWQEPDMAVSGKAIPEPYWYRLRCLQLTEHEDLCGGVRERAERAEGVCNPQEKQQYQSTRPPRTSRD